ncbi:hypothetical protein EIN_355600 [Entamoeba invadens IP1]|uniref:Uncharacterized protein n=1 Tax=Entamoeba invadens IP1 TaxID=370355 RepID=L7FNT1_ENTIV|nr:hypothetical protein EIN_355600 [Entamoeba invadens IP1]ELP92539.1 hypothetical protein EIN_355600 [Entamoeba invadens IP1]|eukprot:XP_004259310.1 hypothetical protein EIN_355600 [Entamoeba invadens IP1]
MKHLFFGVILVLAAADIICQPISSQCTDDNIENIENCDILYISYNFTLTKECADAFKNFPHIEIDGNYKIYLDNNLNYSNGISFLINSKTLLEGLESFSNYPISLSEGSSVEIYNDFLIQEISFSDGSIFVFGNLKVTKSLTILRRGKLVISGDIFIEENAIFKCEMCEVKCTNLYLNKNTTFLANSKSVLYINTISTEKNTQIILSSISLQFENIKINKNSTLTLDEVQFLNTTREKSFTISESTLIFSRENVLNNLIIKTTNQSEVIFNKICTFKSLEVLDSNVIIKASSVLNVENTMSSGDSIFTLFDKFRLHSNMIQMRNNSQFKIDANEGSITFNVFNFFDVAKLNIFNSNLNDKNNKNVVLDGVIVLCNTSEFEIHQGTSVTALNRITLSDYSLFIIAGYFHSTDEILTKEKGLIFNNNSSLLIYDHAKIESISFITLYDYSKATFKDSVYLEAAKFTCYNSSQMYFEKNSDIQLNTMLTYYNNSISKYSDNVTIFIDLPQVYPNLFYTYCLLSFNNYSSVEFSSSVFLTINSCIEFWNSSRGIFPSGSHYEIYNSLFFFNSNSEHNTHIEIENGAVFFIYSKHLNKTYCKTLTNWDYEQSRQCYSLIIFSQIQLFIYNADIYKKTIFTLLNGSFSFALKLLISSENCFDFMSINYKILPFEYLTNFLIVSNGRLIRYCPDKYATLIQNQNNFVKNKDEILFGEFETAKNSFKNNFKNISQIVPRILEKQETLKGVIFPTEVYCHINDSNFNNSFKFNNLYTSFTHPHCPYPSNETHPMLVISEVKNISIGSDIEEVYIDFKQDFLVDIVVDKCKNKNLLKEQIPYCTNYIAKSVIVSRSEITFTVNCKDTQTKFTNKVVNFVCFETNDMDI